MIHEAPFGLHHICGLADNVVTLLDCSVVALTQNKMTSFLKSWMIFINKMVNIALYLLWSVYHIQHNSHVNLFKDIPFVQTN